MAGVKRVALLLASGLIAACETQPPEAAWHAEPGHRWRDLQPARRGPGWGRGAREGFRPLDADDTRLVHGNHVDDENALANRNLLLGAGVAIGDIDEDGLPDVFVAAMERPAALYRNIGGNRFEDVTTTSGVDTRGHATTGAVFADVDGDRHLDLIVGTLGGPLMLWKGNGTGRFADATAASGLVGGYAVTTLALADADGDGDLDLYVATYKMKNALDAYPPDERTFEKTVRKVGDTYVVADEWKAEFRLEDRPELGGVMRSQRAEADLYFENDGAGRFTRVAQQARFVDDAGRPIAEEPDYFTLAARFYDVNGDGAPDLYVCNDFEDPDQFWINRGDGTFRLTSWRAVRETSILCMSVDFADIDRDSHVDFFTADMMSPMLEARQRQFPVNVPQPKVGGLPRERQQWMRNTLQLGRGDGTWASIGDLAGVTATDWTWGSAFLDVDLDGFEDLLAVNGHRWDVRDADSFQRIRHSIQPVPFNREQAMFPRSATRNFAFRNNADLTFADRSSAWRFGADAGIHHGIALADTDGDGDLDVLVTRLNDTPVLYRNESTAPRVAVRLVGRAPNTSGIGSRVSVRAASLPEQTREMTSGGYYLSGSEPQLAFATGADTTVHIEVRWRDGATSTIANARPNRLYEIHQPEHGVRLAGAADSNGMPADRADALFEDATALLGGHAHVDAVFDDYRRQPLLPNRFSQLGPGITWFDSDGDGRADLLIGTGRGGRPALLRNTGSGFVSAARGVIPASSWDLTTMLPVPDGRGGTLVVAGQANHEANSATEALGVAAAIALPVAPRGALGSARPALPPDSASTGPLALDDVNGDGRLDLFVGGRLLPAAWPLPAASRLYLRSADGGWALDSVNAGLLRSVGLVSAAVFTDFDGDGWRDLVLTAEWGPIRLLRNDRGRLRDVTREMGLSGITSRWNGLNAGDFDGDGRMDLVVTSWGRNIPWRASPERPYTLVLGHFGGHGMGLLFAQRDSATGREMPLQSLERIALGVPSVRTRFTTFAEFSRATMDQVLGDAGRGAVRVGATTFDHLVLLNRGTRFEARPLPVMAQLAPAFAPVVADFDGDGNEDLFLAQNFMPTEIDTPMFHAGVGVVLLGDGRGSFRALGVNESAVRVWGDQRGAAAADFDGDGRVDLAVTQNAAPTTLWRNRAAIPGIRVSVSGGSDNPLGIGTQLRIVGGDRGSPGPVREIRAGSGYWSMDDPVTVLAQPPGEARLWIRWPGGQERWIPLTSGQRSVRVSR